MDATARDEDELEVFYCLGSQAIIQSPFRCCIFEVVSKKAKRWEMVNEYVDLRSRGDALGKVLLQEIRSC